MNLRIFDAGQPFTPLPETLRPWLEEASHSLSGRDYGGPMEHLWIEVEIYEYGMNVPDRPPWPFRFQKRVAPRLPSGLGPANVHTNVGHYGVRPIAEDMRADSAVVAARQVLRVVLKSTDCLRDKRQIRGFDVARFQSDLFAAFERFGLVESGERRASG
jgi:hypothetical protein